MKHSWLHTVFVFFPFILVAPPHHRALEANGGNFYFPAHCDGVHLVKRDAMSVLHKVATIVAQLDGENKESCTEKHVLLHHFPSNK